MLRGWHANNGVALAIPISVLSAPSKALTARTDWKAITANTTTRSMSINGWCSRAISKRRCLTRQCAGIAGQKLAEAAAGKSLSQLCDGICTDRRARDGAIVRTGGWRPSSAPHRQADRHAVFRRGRAGLSASRGAAKQYAAFLCALFEAQDDLVDVDEAGGIFEIRQQTWKLMADVGDYHPACASVLHGLLEGLAAGCGRHIPVSMRAGRRRRTAVRLVDRLIEQ